MRKDSFVVAVVLLLITLASCYNESGRKVKELNEVINTHFEAINERNIDNLIKTVNKDSIQLILPSGKYSKSFEEYKEINQKWFGDKNWSIQHQIVEQIVNEKTAIVLAKINYADLDEHNEAYNFEYYLTLIFSYANQKWELIFDQNTLIK